MSRRRVGDAQGALAAAGSNLLVLAGGKGFRDDLLSTDGVALAQAGAALVPLGAPAGKHLPEAASPRRKVTGTPAAAKPAPKPKVEEVSPEAVKAAAAEMDALLNGAASLPKNNLDEFWDTLAQEQPAAKTSQDVLTWEEARKLGLTHE